MRASRGFVRWVILPAILAFSPPASARAQSARVAQSDPALEQRVKELEETVRRLQRSQGGVEDLIDDKIRQAKPVAGYKDGFFIQTQDGDWRLRLGGYTQFDGRFFPSDAKGLNTDQFVFRRVRPILEGTVAKYFDFRIMPDFAGSKIVLFDAYADFKYWPQAKLRAGKFKPPVGLERLQSATAIVFAERAAPTNLVPNRDLGIQLFGDLWNGALSYQLGVFNELQDLANNDGDVGDDKEFAGRIFAQPFVNTSIAPLAGLGFGIAGTYGNQQGSLSSPELATYKSPGQANIFSYRKGDTLPDTVIADGILYRWTPQAYYYFGPLGLLFEYVESDTPVTKDKTSETLSNHAWEVTASWVLTGEKASFRGVTPDRPFDPRKNQWGAFEVAFRADSLDIDGDAFAKGFADPKKAIGRATGYAGGINWYLNKNIKLVLDYFHSDFRKGGSTGDRPREEAIIGRVQLVL